MTDKVEVKIVGDESSAQAALRRSAAAVTEASNVMRDRLGAIRDRSREAFAGMAQDAQKAEGDVQQATTSIGSAFDRLKARFESFTTGFKQGWREADAEIKAARQSAENASASGGKLERGFGGALEVAKGFVIAKIAEHIAEIGSKTIETATEFERLRSVLTTLQGSEAGGAAQFAQLKKFSTDTPYELSEVVESFAKLKSQGLDPSNAALTSYGNTAAAMGKSLDQMIEAVADAAMGEYERLKEFGIKAVDAGDKVIFNFKGQATEVKKNSADIQAYLQKIGNTDFAGAMDRQMDTLGGKFSNLADAAASFADEIGQGGLSAGLKEAMDAMTGATGSSSELAHGIGQVLGTNIRTIVDVVRTMKDAFNDTFSLIRQIVTDTMGQSAGSMLTTTNIVKTLSSTISLLADIVRSAFQIISSAVQTGINAFQTFYNVVDRALHLDFSGMTQVIEDSVNRQVGIVQNGMTRITGIVADGKARMHGIWDSTWTSPLSVAGNLWDEATSSASNFSTGKGTSFGKAKKAKTKHQSGPSEMDVWRTTLSDGLLEEEQAGRDTLVYTAQFWREKLALTKAGSKEHLEVKRELARAEIALSRQQGQEEIANIRQMETLKAGAVQTDIDLARLALQEKLDMIDAEREAGTISMTDALKQKAAVNREMYQLDLDLEQKIYGIKRASLVAESQQYAEGTAKRREMNGKIEVLEAQHLDKMAILRKQAELKQKKEEDAIEQQRRLAQNRWTQAWSEQIAKLITLQQGFASTLRGIWDSIVGMFEQAVARMVQQWLVGLLTKEAASTAAQRKEVLKTAKEAAAGAFSSVVKIPIVGPILAPAAAAAAFAATVAYSAKDGYDVPNLAGPGVDGRGGQLGVVHPREMVLPAELADIVRNGGMGGGIAVHISAMDGQSVKRVLMDNKGSLAEALRKHLRDGGR